MSKSHSFHKWQQHAYDARSNFETGTDIISAPITPSRSFHARGSMTSGRWRLPCLLLTSAWEFRRRKFGVTARSTDRQATIEAAAENPDTLPTQRLPQSTLCFLGRLFVHLQMRRAFRG